MLSSVIVKSDETTGTVINVSKNNNLYGYVKVEQIKTVIDDNGFLSSKPISALIIGSLLDLELAGFKANQKLDGHIIIEESLTPFNTKNPEKQIKIAGQTGIKCTIDGQPIYRRTRFTYGQSNIHDTLLKHDNTEEIKTALANIENKNIMSNVANDFDI